MSHLTANERDRLAELKADDASLRAIARALGRAASTISRELKRNALDSGAYRPHIADGAYMLRRQRAAVLETDLRLAGYVTARLSEGWTPEQIAGRLRLGIETGFGAVCAPRRSTAGSTAPARRQSGCARSPPSAGWRTLPERRMLLKMSRAMVRLYCASFAQVPKRITLDIDDPFDAVHGGQQLRLFNAHYDDYAFQPIVSSGLRRRRPVCHRGAAAGEAAEGPRDRRSPAAPDPRDPRALAPRGDPAARRRPLLRARGAGPVPGAARGLHPRPADHRVLRRHVSALEASTTARAAAAGGAPSAGLRNSTTPPRPGAALSASSPASMPARAAATRGSSSPA
jgi:Helix-turn-helix domain/Transposase DDE domain group 1